MKLAQAKYLSSQVAKFKKMVSEKFECKPSVIITGDFNSIPGDKVMVIYSLVEFTLKKHLAFIIDWELCTGVPVSCFWWLSGMFRR